MKVPYDTNDFNTIEVRLMDLNDLSEMQSAHLGFTIRITFTILLILEMYRSAVDATKSVTSWWSRSYVPQIQGIHLLDLETCGREHAHMHT